MIRVVRKISKLSSHHMSSSSLGWRELALSGCFAVMFSVMAALTRVVVDYFDSKPPGRQTILVSFDWGMHGVVKVLECTEETNSSFAWPEKRECQTFGTSLNKLEIERVRKT